MNILGKTTIHPFLFYSGKLFGYFTWLTFILSVFNIFIISNQPFEILKILSYILSVIGLLIVVISLCNLGYSTRLGLPPENTTFKKIGLYKLSRNPMYLGFDFFTISTMIFTANIIIILIGFYSIVIYHLIIIGEEKFLEQRFGEDFTRYKLKTRRYI